MSDCHIRARIEQVSIKAKVEQVSIRAAITGGRGPVGPQGPAGPAGGQTIAKTAAVALSGHRAVKAVVAGVDYPRIDALGDADLVLGITTGAAEAGADAQVQTMGEMFEPSWAWSLGPVFCGNNGVLTQDIPAGAWIRQVGVAVAADRLFIELRPPIFTL